MSHGRATPSDSVTRRRNDHHQDEVEVNLSQVEVGEVPLGQDLGYCGINQLMNEVLPDSEVVPAPSTLLLDMMLARSWHPQDPCSVWGELLSSRGVEGSSCDTSSGGAVDGGSSPNYSNRRRPHPHTQRSLEMSGTTRALFPLPEHIASTSPSSSQCSNPRSLFNQKSQE